VVVAVGRPLDEHAITFLAAQFGDQVAGTVRLSGQDFSLAIFLIHPKHRIALADHPPGFELGIEQRQLAARRERSVVEIDGEPEPFVTCGTQNAEGEGGDDRWPGQVVGGKQGQLKRQGELPGAGIDSGLDAVHEVGGLGMNTGHVSSLCQCAKWQVSAPHRRSTGCGGTASSR
nr:hypothetical protein [Tanacetum cinerariifolium]